MSKRNRKLILTLASLGSLAISSSGNADTVALLPTQWNTISSAFTTTSDGSGFHTFAGGGRETLLEFNLTSIPAGAIINSAVLTMYMDRSQVSTPASQPIFVYRATSSWGMGTSGLGQVDNGITGGGGNGYAVTNNDATWNYRLYNAATPASSISWTTAGGDYVSTASAFAQVGSGIASTATPGPGSPILSTWSGAGLVSDVQAWLNGTNANDGWLLNDFASSADFPPSGNTFGSDIWRRFISPADNLNGTAGTADDRPFLTVTFTSVPEPVSLGILAFAGVFLQGRWWRAAR